MVFLVILAGGVVRMTQSGMGCPDWPKCFGLWIPPTDVSELPHDFEKYLEKQDIDHSFNVYHTWIEYINRLLGAILGVFIIINMWLSRKFWTIDRKIFWASLVLLISVGFQGWLGKLVVDSNLSVVKISVHMLVAIFIVVLPLYNISRLKDSKIRISSSVFYVLCILLGLSLIQVLFGTQVREQIDIISKSLSYEQRELWIERLDSMFIVHRSFSWLILASSIYLWYKSRTETTFRNYANYILFSVLSILVLGIVMIYLDMPAIAQPLHLLFACGLVSLLFYVLFRTYRSSMS